MKTIYILLTRSVPCFQTLFTLLPVQIIPTLRWLLTKT